MDSVSQIVLGGAVAFAVAGKTAPRKAILWGAVIATVPDLDVLVLYTDIVDSVTKHRSWSHSWLTQTLFAPILALLLHRIDSVFTYKQWTLLAWLALITHSCLDAQTVYGTQIFWPFMPPPYSGGSVFIIDPAYTIPLLIGFLAVLFKPLSQLSGRLIRGGLLISTAYLIWGLAAQNWVLSQAKMELTQQGIATEKILVSATPFNTLLWRVLVMDDNYYYEGFRSVFDGDSSFQFSKHAIDTKLIESLQDNASLQRLQWFTNGFYSVNQVDETVVVTDLRMGLEPVYFFIYGLARINGSEVESFPAIRIVNNASSKRGISWVWQRIWSPNTVSLEKIKQNKP